MKLCWSMNTTYACKPLAATGFCKYKPSVFVCTNHSYLYCSRFVFCMCFCIFCLYTRAGLLLFSASPSIFLINTSMQQRPLTFIPTTGGRPGLIPVACDLHLNYLSMQLDAVSSMSSSIFEPCHQGQEACAKLSVWLLDLPIH